ncbi:hypothetical protein [Lysobacter gummosus]
MRGRIALPSIDLARVAGCARGYSRVIHGETTPGWYATEAVA